MNQLKNQFLLPYEEEFKDYLIIVFDFTSRSAGSYVSRLRRLITTFGDKKSIAGIKDVIYYLSVRDFERAILLLDSISGWADENQNNGSKGIPDKPFAECRTAINRYIEFLLNKHDELEQLGLLYDKYFKKITSICNKYQKKAYKKSEILKVFIYRRGSDDRLTGDVYYPIRLLKKIFKNDPKISIDDYLSKLAKKVKFLIDKSGNYVTFEDLIEDSQDDAMIIEKEGVKIKCKDGSVYTVLTKDVKNNIKPLKVRILDCIDLDHDTPISTMLNSAAYPNLKKLTDLIRQNPGINIRRKDGMVIFIKKYQNEIDSMKQGLIDDLQKLLDNTELTAMDRISNRKKGNRI